VRAPLTLGQRLRPGWAAELTVAPALDLQGIQVIGGESAPSRVSVELSLGIRAGR